MKQEQLGDSLAAWGPALSPVLREVYEDGTVEKPDGTKLKVVAQIGAVNAYALHRYILVHKPACVVEIGMAYGVSTLSILSAMEQVDHGRLISVDPYYGWPTGRAVALWQVKRAGFQERHEYMDLPSYRALVRIEESGVMPDLVYIDGNHATDYALVDTFIADKLLKPGGVIAFNDAGWRSVFRALKYLGRYRRYAELEVGLPRTYPSSHYVFSIVKRLMGRSQNDRYFRKVEAWEPPHGFNGAF